MFLKKILLKIKSLFREKHQEEITTTVSYIDLVPQLKHVDTDALYKSIRPGNILYIITPASKQKLEKLSMPHRTRPFIVAKKEDGYVYGYCGSSHAKSYKHSFYLSKTEYHVSKNGMINLGHTYKITKDMLVNYVDNLEGKDIKIINQRLANRKDIEKAIPIDSNRVLVPGQVIYVHNTYHIIYSIKHSSLSAYPLSSKYEPSTLILPFRNKQYYIDPNSYCHISLQEDIHTTSTIHPLFKQQMDSLLQKKKNQSKKQSKHHPSYEFPMGQVFELGEKVYIYLYTEKGKDYGIDLPESELDIVDHINKLPDLHYCSKQEILPSEDLTTILSELTYYSKQFTWLLEEQNKNKTLMEIPLS